MSAHPGRRSADGLPEPTDTRRGRSPVLPADVPRRRRRPAGRRHGGSGRAGGGIASGADGRARRAAAPAEHRRRHHRSGAGPDVLARGLGGDEPAEPQASRGHGLTFDGCCCNAAMCSPSRSTFFTGLYPAQHGVTATLTEGGTVSPTEPTLPLGIQNMAKLLDSAGYNVHYRGKWHMSKGEEGGDPSSADVAAYGFRGWVPPEGGQDTDPDHFGGGCADLDSRYASEAVEFLQGLDPNDDRPFALVVSFVNPHDVLAYPRRGTPSTAPATTTVRTRPESSSRASTCRRRTKRPWSGTSSPPRRSSPRRFSPPAGSVARAGRRPQLRELLRVHAQGCRRAHRGGTRCARIPPGMRESTVVIRISDHGEMGMSHGGLRQKVFNAYEETLRVPLVVSNPCCSRSPSTPQRCRR
ncbi:sulfatase-like hydrolase/transferase [Rhodococcus hoagii]|nr:sulfatase-like hydrolase/transferase [Prescottella equi]